MHALVVGASGGLGTAFVRQLADDPRVTRITGWSRTHISAAGAKLNTRHIDLLDETTIEAAACDLGDVDLVIVATGLLHDAQHGPEKTWRAIDPAAMRRQFEVNTIGPAIVAKHVIPHLVRDRRAVLALLSARVGSISDNRMGGWHSYRASKAALNQIIRCLGIELAAKHRHAICVGLHPGTVDTALSRPFQAGVAEGRLFTAEQSAAYLLGVIDGLTTAQSGHVFDWAGKEISP